MTYSYVLGEQLGFAGSAELVEHGLTALDTVFRDEEYGGWFEAIDEFGVVDSTKNAYPHAFVILAASAAAIAGYELGKKILDDALHLLGAFLGRRGRPGARILESGVHQFRALPRHELQYARCGGVFGRVRCDG